MSGLETPIHFNGDLPCAIDLEFTGLDPEVHSIFDMAFIPLTPDLKPNKKVPWFNVQIRPDSEEFDPGILSSVQHSHYNNCLTNGLEPEIVRELFEDWLYKKIGLQANKKLVPVVHNWRTDSMFLEKFFGPIGYRSFFSHRVRDTLVTADFINDNCYFSNKPMVFTSRFNLSNLAIGLGLDFEKECLHTAGYDAMLTAEIYRKMILLPKF